MLARLAVSILTRDDLEPSMKLVDGQYGLPPLPEAEFTLLSGIGCRSSATGGFARLALELPEATSMSAAF